MSKRLLVPALCFRRKKAIFTVALQQGGFPLIRRPKASPARGLDDQFIPLAQQESGFRGEHLWRLSPLGIAQQEALRALTRQPPLEARRGKAGAITEQGYYRRIGKYLETALKSAPTAPLPCPSALLPEFIACHENREVTFQ